MTTFNYVHTPHAKFADDGQPRFFRRRYGGNPTPPEMLNIGGKIMAIMSLEPDEAIWIYGYSYDSEFREDHEQQEYAWRGARNFLAYCYSTMCPRGEPGMVPIDVVEEISQDDFETAAAQDWK